MKILAIAPTERRAELLGQVVVVDDDGGGGGGSFVELLLGRLGVARTRLRMDIDLRWRDVGDSGEENESVCDRGEVIYYCVVWLAILTFFLGIFQSTTTSAGYGYIFLWWWSQFVSWKRLLIYPWQNPLGKMTQPVYTRMLAYRIFLSWVRHIIHMTSYNALPFPSITGSHCNVMFYGPHPTKGSLMTSVTVSTPSLKQSVVYMRTEAFLFCDWFYDVHVKLDTEHCISSK